MEMVISRWQCQGGYRLLHHDHSQQVLVEAVIVLRLQEEHSHEPDKSTIISRLPIIAYISANQTTHYCRVIYF